MRLGLFGISLTTFEPLDAALVARAATIGVDRLIVYPIVPAAELEAAVRALGSTLAPVAAAAGR